MTDFYVIFLENYSEYLNKARYLTIRQALFLFLWIKSIGMIEINCNHMETFYWIPDTHGELQVDPT